ncbi:MAG: isopeptide-forming domain-containing fimbrial protein [Clostridia bacterium]|nr:isopeptide-forming domain-containing fimbrial protein [Clostridia bacterium]
MKKILSLLLALSLVMGLSVTAFAAGTEYTITLPDDNHTYEIYQIFTGDLSESTLSNVKWGKNGNGNVGDPVPADTLTELEALKDASDAEVLAKINTYVNFSDPYAEVVTNEVKVPEGYYLIKDKDGTIEGNDAYTTYIVRIVKDVTINRKADVPEVVKKVQDTNDSVTNSTSDWQDSADYDKGDEVPFQLTATLPTNYADYSKYKLVFHDVMSESLKFNENTVKVYAVNGDAKTEIASANYRVEAPAVHGEGENAINHTFDVLIEDLTEVTGVSATSKIVVEYTATLDTDEVVKSSNTVVLEYSNNPNYTGDGTEEPTGKTPEDTVVVFTYKAIINKVDENLAALKGAEFALDKYVVGTGWVTLTVVNDENGTTFKFAGLDDGYYRLRETLTPAGYNTIEDVYFMIEAAHDVEAVDPQLTELKVTRYTDEKFDTIVEEDKVTFEAIADLTEGSLTSKVVNKTGSILPETGGIGTTIFYALGAVMVIGAGVLLIAKKRMSNEG